MGGTLTGRTPLANGPHLGDRPKPPKLWRRETRALFEDATDHLAIGEDIEVILAPRSGRARRGRAFEDQ